MDQVFSGVMRSTEAVKIQSTPIDIQVATSGPAIVALIGSGEQETLNVRFPDPSTSKGGMLEIKCAISSQTHFRLEDGTIVGPGDYAKVASDGQAWYRILTHLAAKSAQVGPLSPGQDLDLDYLIRDPRVSSTSIITVSPSTQGAEKSVQWVENLHVFDIKDGSFRCGGRVKNTIGQPVSVFINYRIG